MKARNIGLIGSFALLLALRCGATIVPSLTFEQMTDQSEIVVQGQVTRSWSDWDSEHKYIWTHYELAVSGTHKGRAGATVVVSEPGGAVGERAMTIAGVVGYAPGEQVAVFLQRMPNGYLRTTGWGQGKFAVDTTGHLHAAGAMRGMEVIELDQKTKAPRGTPLRALEGISTGDLKTRVAARVAVTGGASR